MFESCCVVYIPPKSVNPAVSVHMRLRFSSGLSCFDRFTKKHFQISCAVNGPQRIVSGGSWMFQVWVGCSVCAAGWIHTYTSAPEAQPRFSTCWRHSGVFWTQQMHSGIQLLSSYCRTIKCEYLRTSQQGDAHLQGRYHRQERRRSTLSVTFHQRPLWDGDQPVCQWTHLLVAYLSVCGQFNVYDVSEHLLQLETMLQKQSVSVQVTGFRLQVEWFWKLSVRLHDTQENRITGLVRLWSDF